MSKGIADPGVMPFDRKDFLDVFAAYNEAFWPVALVLWLITAVAVVHWIAGGRRGEPLLRGVLAANWLWAALAYHAMFFTRINPAAWVFAALFVIQALVLYMSGRYATRNGAAPPPERWSAGFGLALMALGLAYPAVVSADGLVYPYAPTFGVPCPTAMLTLGFLLATPTRTIAESIVPIVWSLVAASAAWLFGVHADLALLAGAGVLALDLLRSCVVHRGALS